MVRPGLARQRRVATFAAAAVALGVASLTLLFRSPERYRAEDFPCSTLESAPCRPAVSAERANRVADGFRRHTALSTILRELATGRGGVGAAEGVTAPRERVAVEEQQLDSRRGPEWKVFHERALRELRFGPGEGFRPLVYVSTAGKNLFAGEIRASGFTARIRLPEPARAWEIVNDSFSRLESLRNSSAPTDRTHAAFLDSLHGVLVAGPFSAENGAITHELFAGVHQVLYGTRLPPLPDGVEWLALTALTPAEFRAEVARALRWPLPR